MYLYLRIFIFFLPFLTWAQELPPVNNYTANQYKAGNQNWKISQAENKNLYIANSSGLLEYSGAEWNLYPVPNNSVVRSVKVVGDLIFTGAYMELGYWKKNNYGLLEYVNLLPKMPNPVSDGEQFWHMENVGDLIVIQSFEGLYIYDIEKDEIVKVETSAFHPVTNLFKVDKDVFFQIAEEGLFVITNGRKEEVIPVEILQNKEIMHVFRALGDLHLITGEGEFYIWNGKTLTRYNEELSKELEGLSVFSAVNLSNGSILMGTVEDGIYQINQEGKVTYHFNQQNGLINNTVLSLFLDEDENVWVGLDNGLSVINYKSPFRLFQDSYGKIGSVYTSLQTDDYLYLGTNQGLYYKENSGSEFYLIAGTNGQVWSLQEIDGIIFCGHNRGTFTVKNTTATKLADRFGTWIVKKYAPDPDYYIQGHYNGFSFLKREGENISELPMVEGFPHSSKFIVTDKDGDIWIGNEHKGIFRIKMNDSLTAISNINNYTFEGIAGINSSMFRFNDSLYFSAKEQIYVYNERENQFTKENSLATTLKDFERISGRIINDDENKIWGFTKNSFFTVEVGQLSPDLIVRSTYLPNDLRNIALGYENITRLSKDDYLVGVANGYLLFDTSGYSIRKNEIRFDRIIKSALDKTPEMVSLTGEAPFHYKTNNISFNFSIPEYKKFLLPVYSYRLLGLSNQWSDWKEESAAAFNNLPFGTYEFQVRGRVGEQITPIESFTFEIDRPWFFSTLAIIVYVFLFLVIIFMVHKFYQKQHRKLILENEKELRMKNLEAEQRIIKLQNEQLEREMTSKNKELAVSTMSLIKKNEFLTSIKDKLKDSGDSQGIKSVIKTIDKDISEEDNWKFFKEAFSNADKDFFKKIKKQHPHLTPNDLKLCAYLRLNLSSKEIAPLLNISVKSVEIKRYRLRKKMDLPRERQLTDYILEI